MKESRQINKHDLQKFHQSQVVQKTVNANPGLKFNRGNNFSTTYVLCSLRLLKLKTEGQTY